MDFPTLGRPTSATTGTMFKASFKKSSDNARHFYAVVKNRKTAPTPGAVF
ncbi:hypothetical protein FORC89_1231 [Salmonella sp. FORC89]|nr:hypothetical protein FORC19_1185 [Salmonella enterica]AQU53128.1 hypothetical protein SEETMRM10607_13500 [Salmonella enterica subsp. enterica serovar Typhimurium]EDY24868.1 hypothetical protein SeSPA_A3146 [Salmonella enterica subsp. enterica serovar Saintpaul str. SARA23]EDZ16596.1 hypothetical protein SeI_A1986 [Salmonella enterica subsp. enterica serovar 4 [Salmonella enterica subsp. enterica serovar 4 [Salmonella enterica subsp. enterica serovar 4,[5],12:i:- str. CVM23701]QDX90733.1 hypo